MDYPLAEPDRRFSPVEEITYALRMRFVTAVGTHRGSPCDARLEAMDEVFGLTDHENEITDIRLKRGQILRIWPPLTTSGGQVVAGVTWPPVPTLPPGFDRAEWTVEHALAWLSFRHIESLQSLELLDPKRPPFFGRHYRGGYVDASSFKDLWTALQVGEVPAWSNGDLLGRTMWPSLSIWDTEGIWIRRERILTLWPNEEINKANECLREAWFAANENLRSSDDHNRVKSREAASEPVPNDKGVVTSAYPFKNEVAIDSRPKGRGRPPINAPFREEIRRRLGAGDQNISHKALANAILETAGFNTSSQPTQNTLKKWIGEEKKRMREENR